jgi:hypothetical protein
MENLVAIALGVVCIILGILNFRGSSSSLHSYHRRRVSEEDKPKFAKLIGIGTIIDGASFVAMGALSFLSEELQNGTYMIVGSAVLTVGFVVGLGISFYAMIKYNKGIF